MLHIYTFSLVKYKEPTPAPVIVQTHKVECPQTLQCMLQCKNGYHLGSAGRDGCPTCSCLARTYFL